MDVKTGSGAFMPTLEGARDLAESIASVANGAGLPTVALITNMGEPLASAAGNAVEVLNAVDYLTGAKRDARLHAVTLALGAELLTLAGLARDRLGARAALERSLANGAAAERFERMVAALGGPADLLAKARELLPAAPVVVAAAPERPGFVLSIDAREVGLAVVELGGGRARAVRCDRSGGRPDAARRDRRRGLGRRAAGAGPRARRGERRRGEPPPQRRLSHRRRAAGQDRRSGDGADRRRRRVSLLFAAPGWDEGPWLQALRRAAAGPRARHAGDARRPRRRALRDRLASAARAARRTAAARSDLLARRRRRRTSSPTRTCPTSRSPASSIPT